MKRSYTQHIIKIVLEILKYKHKVTYKLQYKNFYLKGDSRHLIWDKKICD